MPNYDTRLSGAGYGLKRVFAGVWRWRVFASGDDGTGLAWGRRGAMRAARTYLRDRKPPRPTCATLPANLTAVPDGDAIRQPLETAERTPRD